MPNCELCGTEEELSQHHLIPRAIKVRIGPYNDEWKNKTIGLCRRCHSAVHECFIDHLAHREKGQFSRLDALKYIVLKEYLRTKHPQVYDEWRNFFTELIRNDETI